METDLPEVVLVSLVVDSVLGVVVVSEFGIEEVSAVVNSTHAKWLYNRQKGVHLPQIKHAHARKNGQYISVSTHDTYVLCGNMQVLVCLSC